MLIRVFGIYLLLCTLFHNGNKTTLYAQEVSGIVIDEETGIPVAFANISIKGEPVGTISNQKGRFHLKLPGGYEKKTLIISFVGYQTRRFPIESFHPGQIVKLKQVPAEIGEVSVRPDSTLFTLLKKAWDRIPDNYASNPSLLTGFYRESILNPSGKYLSVAEAVINSYKTSYKNRQIGQVQILKSRKNIMPGIDSINRTLFYGGPFVANFADLVHQRKAPINPSFFKNYKYEYLGHTLYNGESVYKFAYRNFKDTTKIQRSGIFYIEIASLAYIYFESRTEGLWYQDSPNVLFKSSTKKILYQKDNDSWFLKSVIASHHAINLQTNKDLLLKIDYVTTNYSDKDILPIDYDQQIKYGDIFTSLADNYEDSFWKDYTILEQDSLSKKYINEEFSSAQASEFLSRKFEKPLTPAEKLHRIISRLNMEMGFYFHEYSFPVNNSSASFNEYTVSNNHIRNQSWHAGATMLMGYKLTNRLSINYQLYQGLDKKILFESNNFGLTYLICLKPGGRQFFAEPGLWFNMSSGGYNIGTMPVNGTLNIEGRKIKSDYAYLYAGMKQKGILADLRFKTFIRPRMQLVAGINYKMPVSRDDFLIVKEKKWLVGKTAYQPINEKVIYSENGIRSTVSAFNTNRWMVTLGVSFVY